MFYLVIPRANLCEFICTFALGNELVGDEVEQFFLKERQLNGDFVTRAFDMLQRRNYELKFDDEETSVTEETTNEMYDDVSYCLLSFLK